MTLVFPIDPQELAETDATREKSIASWESGIYGDDWINALVREGKAYQISRNGYPNRYTAFAKDVLAYVATLPDNEDYTDMQSTGRRAISNADWVSRTRKDAHRILACNDDQIVTVHVWDQS